jgi:hypothetical protein
MPKSAETVPLSAIRRRAHDAPELTKRDASQPDALDAHDSRAGAPQRRYQQAYEQPHTR